jgi:hypothetical protein
MIASDSRPGSTSYPLIVGASGDDLGMENMAADDALEAFWALLSLRLLTVCAA